jgi:biopolymer transport protein ExbD
MTHRRAAVEEKPIELNMTPMIDVVFQLLIFFMLSMRFGEVEGRLLTTLPRHKGTVPSSPPAPDLAKIRIIFCAGVDPAAHLADRKAHDAGGSKDGRVCTVAVETGEIGVLRSSRPGEDRSAENRRVCRAAAQRARDILASAPSALGRPTPVVLDADREVPYEHVIGMVDACKEAGIDNIEFTASTK